ncbi:MAG TPA: cellulase family glycosylhydrolase [Anaerolineae bacterium]|nr:cellulase family glycosylhydrolase [Anaerolineae bacterium]
MGISYNNRGLSGRRLYVAVAAWLVLVLVGGFCTWYGWLGPGGESSEEVAEATSTPEEAAAPTAEPTAVPPDPTPTAAAVLPTVVQAEEVFGYGIAINGTGGGDINYWMDQVESLGLGWAKQQVRWGYFEGNPGQMDWSGYDAVVDAANQRGIKVMLSVVEAPHWSRTYFDDNVEVAPPDDLTLLADFMGRMVDRYQGRIHAIEVWNEQNLDREWDTAEGVNAERYVEMLRLAYQAIKSRDPNIIVISGALSPVGATATDPNNPDRVVYMDDFDYFDQMIAAGFLNYCDCVGAHHNGINMPPNVAWDEGYNDPTAQFRGPFDNPDHSWSFKSTLWGYHDRIVAAGSDKPLCVTEFGWATSEGFDGYPPGFEFALDNTLGEQAQWDVEAFQLMRQWGFVRMAFLWNLNYSQLGWGPEDPNAPYALIDFKGIGRPAFGAIGAMEKP